MVELFRPKTTRSFKDERDLSRQLDYSDVEALLQAESREKLSAYRLSRGSIFAYSDNLSIPDDTESLAFARSILLFAMSAKNCAVKTVAKGVPLAGETMTSDLSEYDFCNLEELGYKRLVPKCAEIVEVKPSSKSIAALREKIELLRLLGDVESFAADPGDARFLEYTGDVTGAVLKLSIPFGPYASYLYRSIEEYGYYKENLGEACEWEAWYERADEEGEAYLAEGEAGDTLVCACSMGLFEMSYRGAVDLLNKIVDSLFTIHLTGLRTVSVNGGKEIRRADTGLASLWWCTLDMLREGRIDACWACGKPFIAYNERGKQRRYCSDSCKQWRKKHKGNYLRSEYAKMTPEERKAADAESNQPEN